MPWVRRAQSIAEVGVCPLSRRDRAAMAAALECLCEMVSTRVEIDVLCSIDAALSALTEIGCVVSEDIEAAVPRRRSDHRIYTVPARLLRARLALLLRTLLRVDRGDVYDCEPRYFRDCRERWADGWQTDRLGNWWRPKRMRPLWESAPPHEVSR